MLHRKPINGGKIGVEVVRLLEMITEAAQHGVAPGL
jgi:hypothetical protein